MRTAKLTLLVLASALVCASCNSEPPPPDAFRAMTRNKFVRIATDASRIPFEFGDAAGVQGLDVDIGNEIAKEIGAELGIAEFEARWFNYPFLRTFELLEDGDVEMIISSISITPERSENFAFSEPYFTSKDAIARRRDTPEIEDLASLSGRKVGVVEGSTHDKFMETQTVASDVTVVKLPTVDDALGSLNRREVDAVLAHEPILTFSIYKSFPNLLTTGVQLEEKHFGILVRKNDEELLRIVNATLSRLKSEGQVEALTKKWFQTVMEEAKELREKLAQEEALKKAPKNITINLVRAQNYNAFSMDRLDGFQAQLVGDGQSYTSQPILTEGLRGSCRFTTGVPPGDYILKMSIFNLSQPLTIREIAETSIIFDMTISGRGINISEREK